MTVMVTMEVGPVDWERFSEAAEWLSQQAAPGLHHSDVYRREDAPDHVLVVQEWDDHDAFHTASDGFGDEFNERAGTEGLDWRTGVWSASMSAVPH